MNPMYLTQMFKVRKKMFSAPSVHFGDAGRGPQGVTPTEAGGVGAPLVTESLGSYSQFKAFN